jgi:putative membrane protein
MEDIIVRYVHFVAIIVLSAALVAEHLLLKPVINGEELRKLAIIDLVYGIAALVVLAAGLALWLWVGKPAEFYTNNGIFHAKLTLFVVMGLISIRPTVFFIRNRRAKVQTLVVPRSIVMIIRAELLLLLVLPLLAVLMAQGHGLAR